jgi:murein DD-endopeptidase MepM/ murein hydrolase activator NlpD
MNILTRTGGQKAVETTRIGAVQSFVFAAAALLACVHAAHAATNADAAKTPIAKSQLALTTHANLPHESRVPGGIALVPVGSALLPPPNVMKDGARLWVARRGDTWVAVVGIPLAATPGEHAIDVATSERAARKTFHVKAKRYPVQNLKLNKAMVDPPPEVMARIERESARLKTVRSTWRASDTTSAAFTLPAQGRLSSRFGVARVLNGKPRSPHAGLDVAVGTGTPIDAPGDGTVIDADDYYFCGKTMFIDHGNGLITMHCHLSEFIAKVGDNVKQGERIALSGGTGRATGPHLHWSVFLNGVSVEPELFLRTAR